MATVAAVIASTHHPFYFRASTSPPETRPPFADEWVAKIMAFRETLSRARPDVLVMVGSDHFHQLWLDNMPQFLIGKAPFYDANFYNEEREFGLPRMRLRGHEELSSYLLREGLDVLRNPEPRVATAAWLLDSIRAWIPFLSADNVLLVRANAAGQLGAAAALALGIQPRLAALVLAASMVPTTVGGHPFWRHDDPTRRTQHLVHFEKNLAILGGLLVVVLGTPSGNRRGR